MNRRVRKTISSAIACTRRLALACLVACVANGALADAEAPVLSGSQIQAAFLYNFARFVEWPAGTFRAKGSPLMIGILGESAISAELEVIVQGRRINGRPILVKNVATPDEARAVQILFVAVTQEERYAALQGDIRDAPVLTVGESPGFARTGGAIVFVQHEGKLRFEIDAAAVDATRLKVSGELQKLATVVRRAP